GRRVRDVAIMLGAIVGEDARDPATKEIAGKSQADYTKFLDADGLRGARIGIARRMFRGRGKASQVIDQAIARIKELGAVLIDPLDIPSQGKLGNAEHEVLLYEFKHNM